VIEAQDVAQLVNQRLLRDAVFLADPPDGQNVADALHALPLRLAYAVVDGGANTPPGHAGMARQKARLILCSMLSPPEQGVPTCAEQAEPRSPV